MSSSESEDGVQFVFSEQQLLVLHEEKESYRDTNKKFRQKKLNEIFRRMKSLESDEKAFNSKKDTVLMAILTWLQRYARRRTEEKGFLEPWMLRRVVGIVREQDVLRIRDEKFAQAKRMDSDGETQEADNGTDGDDENDSPSKKPKGRDGRKRDKAFNYYQAALTEVVVGLTEEESEEMQVLANSWNEHGPPLETRRKLAVKHTMNKTKLFAHQMYRQYRVRYFFHIAYEDEAGTVLTTAMDYNEELGGGVDYRKVKAGEWKQKGLSQENWRSHMGSHYAPHGEEAPKVKTGSRGRATFSLPQNEYGEPILPDPSKMPADMEAAAYRPHKQKLVRAFITRHYALASGSNTAVPWFILANKLDLCVEEQYIPANVRMKFCDPSRMTLEVLDALLTLWYERQEDPDVEAAFQFKQYPDRDGETHNPMPRKFLPTQVKLAESAQSMDPPPQRGLKKKKKGKKGKKKGKEGGKGRIMKMTESEGEEFQFLPSNGESSDDGDDSGVAERKEKPRPTKSVKFRLAKNKQQVSGDEAEEDFDVGGLHPELQVIHDEVVSKGRKKYRFGPVSRGGLGKEFGFMGSSGKVSANDDQNVAKPTKKEYRFGPASHGGIGTNFSGVIVGSAAIPREETKVKMLPELLDTAPGTASNDSPLACSSQKRPYTSLMGDESVPPSVVTHKKTKLTQIGERTSPVKKQVAFENDRQTRASSKAKEIRTRSKSKKK